MFSQKKIEDTRWYFKTGHGKDHLFLFFDFDWRTWKNRASWITITYTAFSIAAWNHVEENFIELYLVLLWRISELPMWKKGWRPNHWRPRCQGDLSDHLCHHPYFQESHHHCIRSDLRFVKKFTRPDFSDRNFTY